MAITITASPDTITAGYNPIVWTCTSNTATIVRIIADVVIDGTVRANIDKDPRFGTTDTFDFDIQSVVQDYLTENLETISGNDIANAGSSEVEVYLKLYEVVLTGGLLVTAWRENGTGLPEQTSDVGWCINSALQHEETQNLNAFTVDTTSKRFLTNRTTQKLRRTETMQLHFVTNEASVKAKLVQKDSSGSTTSTTAFPGSAETITDKAGVVLLDGSVMDATAATFEITLADSSLADISETVTITIDDSCSSEAVRLKWVNPLGGIDGYTFMARKKEDVSFRSKTFERVVEKGYALKDRGHTVLSITGQDTMELFSDILTNTELQWIAELGLSNNVWIDDGNFVPMVVTSRKIKTIDTEKKRFQASYKLKKANERITQRG